MQAGDDNGKFENDVRISEEELGLKYYPGSVEVRVGCMRMESPTEKTSISVRTTLDSPNKVVDFYRSEFSSDSFSEISQTKNDSEKIELKGRDHSGTTIGVTASRDSKSGLTSITAAHTVKP